MPFDAESYRMGYNDAINQMRNVTPPQFMLRELEPQPAKKPRAKPKRKGRTAAGMASALREANRRARKKNGDFRKGYNQRRVMQMAHKIRRGKK